MIQTAQTQTGDAIPEGSRPEEFLRDADLVAFYEREVAACPEDTDRDRYNELRARLKAARKAAMFTEIALLDADDDE